MDDKRAFEHQVARVMQQAGRPPRPVEAASIVRTVTTTAPRRRWSIATRFHREADASQGRGITMFSALKLGAAAVVVALAGGFLLAGELTPPRGDESAPAAVTDTPSPEAEAPSPVTQGLLSDMVTEEVEPGVLRVVNDGVRDLVRIIGPVVGQDGSVWGLTWDPRSEADSVDIELVRLGVERATTWRLDEADEWLADVEVADDGTIWVAVVADDGSGRLRSFDGETWTTHTVVEPRFDDRRPDVEVTPSGKVWAVQVDGTLGYLEAGGTTWQTLAVPWPGPDYFQGTGFVATDTDVWVPNVDGIWHYADGAWQLILYGEGDRADLPDGTFWALGLEDEPAPSLYRHDTDGWQQWSLDEEGIWPGAWTLNQYQGGPDGSLWAGWTVSDRDAASSDGVTVERCDGISRFDGSAWVRYLPGMCIGTMDVAPDGSVWLNAWEGDDPGSEPDLYVITPAAVASVAATLDTSEPWDLVWFSDSGGWYVADLWAEKIEEELGVEVRVHDHSAGGLSAVEVLESLGDPAEAKGLHGYVRLGDTRDDVAEAEIIVIYGNPEGSGARDDLGTCVSTSTVPRDPPTRYSAEDFDPYREILESIYERVFALVGDRPVVVRAIDLYNPVIADWRSAGIEEECTAAWEAWSDVIRDAAAGFDVPLVSMYDVFNGPDHSEDPREKGYIISDGEHTMPAAREAMVAALHEAGYQPIEP